MIAADVPSGYAEDAGQSRFPTDYSALFTSLDIAYMVDDRRFTSLFILGQADGVKIETEAIISLLQAELEKD